MSRNTRPTTYRNRDFVDYNAGHARRYARSREKAAYVYGAAAPKYDYRTGQEVYKGPDAGVKVAARRNRERAAHMNPGYILFMLLMMAAMCFILISYISLQSRITSSVSDITALESELNSLIAANQERENSINASVDLNEVKNTAITELGMKYPDQGQMVTYTNDKVDYVRQVAPAR